MASDTTHFQSKESQDSTGMAVYCRQSPNCPVWPNCWVARVLTVQCNVDLKQESVRTKAVAAKERLPRVSAQSSQEERCWVKFYSGKVMLINQHKSVKSCLMIFSFFPFCHIIYNIVISSVSSIYELEPHDTKTFGLNFCISCQFVSWSWSYSTSSASLYTWKRVRGKYSLGNNIVSWEYTGGYNGKNPRKLTKSLTYSTLFKWMTATRKWHNNLSVFAAPVVYLLEQTRHHCRNRRCHILQR